MKGLKLSKTSWLILSAGIFVVVLGSLGVTRSQQLNEQNKLEEELNLSTARVEKMQTTDLRPQLEELQQKINESQSQLNEAKERFRQMIASVDVVDKFFAIAENCNVQINSISNSSISSNKFEGIECSSTSIGATVIGDTSDIIDFVISLNDGYTTGYVQSVQLNIPEESDEDDEDEDTSVTATIQMIIYSYEGS